MIIQPIDFIRKEIEEYGGGVKLETLSLELDDAILLEKVAPVSFETKITPDLGEVSNLEEYMTHRKEFKELRSIVESMGYHTLDYVGGVFVYTPL